MIECFVNGNLRSSGSVASRIINYISLVMVARHELCFLYRVLQGTAVLGFAYVERHQRELHAGFGIGMEQWHQRELQYFLMSHSTRGIFL